MTLGLWVLVGLYIACMGVCFACMWAMSSRSEAIAKHSYKLNVYMLGRGPWPGELQRKEWWWRW